MALVKQPVNINFAKGLDTKTDPFQVEAGNFLSLTNAVFQKGKLLQKRNGYGPLAAIGDDSSTFLTTFNGGLTAVGSSLQAYSQSTNTWSNKGTTQPVSLSVLPVIRNNTNQNYADIAVAANGLACAVYTDMVPVAGTPTPSYKYVIFDVATGQNVAAPTLIPVASGSVEYAPKVFLLNKYFIIMFNNLISGVNNLSYVAINSAQPSQIAPTTVISNQYTPTSTGSFDAVAVGNNLYIAWNSNDAGGGVRAKVLTAALTQTTSQLFAGYKATIISI